MNPRVRVYCASPYHRAKMWREDLIPAIYTSAIHVTSTWHENESLEDDNNPATCREAWEQDFKEIRQSDVLLAFAERSDRPNGTLVEIGYALAQEVPVFIVGSFAWGTWRYHPSVLYCTTLREAITQIIGVHADGETR